MMPWDDLELHPSPNFAFPSFCCVPQPNIVAAGAERDSSITISRMGIHIARGDGQCDLVLANATFYAHRHQMRHLPSNVTPIGECNDTADNPRAWGIPERL